MHGLGCTRSFMIHGLARTVLAPIRSAPIRSAPSVLHGYPSVLTAMRVVNLACAISHAGMSGQSGMAATSVGQLCTTKARFSSDTRFSRAMFDLSEASIRDASVDATALIAPDPVPGVLRRHRAPQMRFLPTSNICVLSSRHCARESSSPRRSLVLRTRCAGS